MKVIIIIIIITYHSLTISLQKTKLMAFKERDSVRSKIVIDKHITEKVNSFNYLGNLISYEKEVENDEKLNNYFKTTCNINNKFRPQNTLKKTRRKLCNTLAFQLCCTVEKTGT
jgi:hypothetical protein